MDILDAEFKVSNVLIEEVLYGKAIDSITVFGVNIF
jgi:hypothetical protein